MQLILIAIDSEADISPVDLNIRLSSSTRHLLASIDTLNLDEASQDKVIRAVGAVRNHLRSQIERGVR